MYDEVDRRECDSGMFISALFCVSTKISYKFCYHFTNCVCVQINGPVSPRGASYRTDTMQDIYIKKAKCVRRDKNGHICLYKWKALSSNQKYSISGDSVDGPKLGTSIREPVAEVTPCLKCIR